MSFRTDRDQHTDSVGNTTIAAEAMAKSCASPDAPPPNLKVLGPSQMIAKGIWSPRIMARLAGKLKNRS